MKRILLIAALAMSAFGEDAQKPVIPDAVQIDYLSASLVLADPAYAMALNLQEKAIKEAVAACKQADLGPPVLIAKKLSCGPKPTPKPETK